MNFPILVAVSALSGIAGFVIGRRSGLKQAFRLALGVLSKRDDITDAAIVAVDRLRLFYAGRWF